MLALVLMAGCGASWTLREGDTLPIGCMSTWMYLDADADGWGDPDVPPQLLCAADQAAGLTATNGRDCDDSDPNVTGLVGQVCPAAFVAASAGTVEAGGVVLESVELAWVHGPVGAPWVDPVVAESTCAAWGPGATLASFDDASHLVPVQDRVDIAIGTRTFAAWVGVLWQGDLDDGAWVTADGVGDTLLGAELAWCEGEPGPADFWPDLRVEDPEGEAVMNDGLTDVRLALVAPAAGGWCLGWPDVAGEPFLRDRASLVCERPRPDPVDYAVGAASP